MTEQQLSVTLKPGQTVRSRAADGSPLKLNYNKARTFIDATATGTWVEPPAPNPEPTPPPSGQVWDRVVPAGSYGNIPINVAGERWLFEPGAIVKGKVVISAKNVTLSGLHTTSETEHEAPIIILQGSSGILEDYLIEHIGTPRNGVGYGSIQGHDTIRGMLTGPWTFRRGVQDQKAYGWYGTEVWGITGLVIEDNTYKGKGVPANGMGENGHMSIPRCDGAIVRRNTFDMRDGCWRVIEIVEQNDVQFIDNTILGQSSSRGDVCPLAVGGANKMNRTVIQRNRVRDMQLFVYLAGSGHTITDNRLTNVAIPQQGTATNTTWARNGPNDGPAW